MWMNFLVKLIAQIFWHVIELLSKTNCSILFDMWLNFLVKLISQIFFFQNKKEIYTIERDR